MAAISSAAGGGGPPADTDPPGITSIVALTNGTGLDITFAETMNTAAGGTPAAGDFARTGTTWNPGTVAWQSSTVLRVTSSDGSRIYKWQSITLAYTEGANPLEDAAGNDLDSFGATAITNSSTLLVLAGTWAGYLDASSLSAGPGVWTTEEGTVSGTCIGSPTLNTNWLGTGRKALDLNGTSQYVTADAFAALVSGNDLPFAVAVHAALDDTTARTLFSIGNSGAADYRRLGQLDADTLRFRSIVGGVPANTDAAWIPTTATEYVITASYSGTAVTTTANGVTIHSGAANNTAAITLALFTLGASRDSGGAIQFFDGQFRRSAFRTTEFSAGDVTALQAWLGT